MTSIIAKARHYLPTILGRRRLGSFEVGERNRVLKKDTGFTPTEIVLRTMRRFKFGQDQSKLSNLRFLHFSTDGVLVVAF